MAYNRNYGKQAMLLGIFFIFANVIAGSMNFYLGSGNIETIDNLKADNITIWILIFIPYFLLTEYLPAVAFAFVMQKYSEIDDRNENANAGPLGLI